MKSCLELLDLFYDLSGLKINREKTKAVWLGPKAASDTELLPDSGLHWVHQEKFTVLGITFDMSKNNFGTQVNYDLKRKEVERLLKNWSFRHLTLMGKITGIKSLAIPKSTSVIT